jgi:phage terminase large subunit-like protein
MPPQKVSSRKKDKKWRKQCVEAVSSFGNTRDANGRTSWERKQSNYDIVNSILNENDFKYVLDPYGLGTEKAGNQPAKMRDFNLIFNKISLLKGEEISRPFDFHIMAVNGEAVSIKETMIKDQLFQHAQKTLLHEAGIEPNVNPETGQPEEPEPLEQVQKYLHSSVTDIREQWGSSILNYLEFKEKLPLRFNEGWEHGLTVAEECYYIGITNNQPKVRTCNPINCDFDRNPDNPNIEDGDWFREDRMMTVGQILDEYGDYLTDAEVDKLDKGDFRAGMGMSNQMLPGFAYTQSDIAKHERSSSSNSRARSNSGHYLVTHVVWKSMKKIGFLSYVDENGRPQEEMVDEKFKLAPEQKEQGWSISWRWISDVWHGTKIGDDFYVQIEPLPNQIRSQDNISEVKLPYVGRVYNATNTVQTSLVDLIKPHQYLYNIIWYRLEAEIAKAKGKKMVMDIAQIPRSEGIDLDKWMYFFDNTGIAFINSFEEGKDRFQGKTSDFNQFTNVDMGLSQSVGQYINILGKIEQEIDRMVGITPQREGQVQATETATSTKAAVINSSHITEPWFYIHNEIKKNVLSHLIETAKFAYQGQKKLNYIMDDMQRIYAEIDMDKFADSDYGVFVTNSSRDNAIFQQLQALGGMALQTDKAKLTDIISMYKASSISELSNTIKKSEAAKLEADQAQMKQQQEMQQQQIEAQQIEKEEERNFEAEQNQLDRENKLQEAAIKVTGFDTDTSDNNRLDALEASKTMIEQSKISNERVDKQMDRNHDAAQKAGDRAVKMKEIESRERIEKLKAKTALKNKVPGEK